MIHNLVRKEGVPALAYPDGASEPQQYTLKILCSIPKFVVSLEKSIPVEDSTHLITLRYEGPNIVPGQCALRDDKIPAPPGLLNGLARAGNSQIQALSLKLSQPCSVWYPESLGNRMSSLTGSNELLTLAKATKVLIVFDTNWLGKARWQLRGAIGGSTPLTGISVNSEFAGSYQQSDWSIFDPAQDAKPGTYLLGGDLTSGVIRSIEDVGAGTPPTESEDDDAPPSYAALVTGKRLRDTRPSAKPDTPPPKRLFQDPPRAFSPGERAASASSTDTDQVDLFQAAIEAAVVKHIGPIVAKHVEATVAKMLPDTLHKELGNMYSRPLTGSSPSLSMSAARRRTPNHNLTFEAVVEAAVSTVVKARLGNILTTKVEDALEQISECVESAEVQLEEIGDAMKYDLNTTIEDQLAAFNDDCHAGMEEKYEEFKEHLEESQKGAEEYADELVRQLHDRVDTAAGSMGGRCVKVKQSKSEQTRRTTSLPL